MNMLYRWFPGFVCAASVMLLGACDLADIFGRQEVQESLRHVTFKYHIRSNISTAELDAINLQLGNDPGRINDVAVLGMVTQPVCEVTDRIDINLDMNGSPANLTAGAANTNTFELSASSLQDDSGGACTLAAVDDLVFLSGQDVRIDVPMPVVTLEVTYGNDVFTAVGQHARVILDGFNNNRFATGTFQFLAKRQCAGLSGNALSSCQNDNRVLIVVNGVFADVD